jgi:hypothetical protein
MGISAGVGAIIGGGMSLLGAGQQASAATDAAQTQANAQMQAAQIGQQEFNTITAQEQPFMQAGYGAQNQLNYLLGIGNPQGGYGTQGGATAAPGATGMPVQYGGATGVMGPGASGPGARFADGGLMGANASGPGARLGAVGGGQGYVPPGAPPRPGGGGSFGSLLQPFSADMMKQYSPAYNFQLQQGQQGTLNSANTSGSALAPAAQQALMSYNQNYANTAFQNAFNQYQTQQGNIYNRLSGVAQLGQNAAANLGSQGTQLAGNIGQSVASAGAAQAAGTVGAANAISGGIQSALPWLLAGGGGGGGPYTAGAGGGFAGGTDWTTIPGGG